MVPLVCLLLAAALAGFDKACAQTPTANPTTGPLTSDLYTYSASDTNSAQQNYVVLSPLEVCGTITASMINYGGSCSGDTFLRIADSTGAVLNSNDDGIVGSGTCSEVSYTSSSGCESGIQLRMGCYNDYTCSGTVAVIGASSGVIATISPSIAPSIAPTDDDGYYYNNLNGDDNNAVYVDDTPASTTSAEDYWGAYLGLFGGIYILMMCISGSKFFDKFVKACTLNAYKNVEAELAMDDETKDELELCHKFEDEKLKKEGKTEGEKSSISLCACYAFICRYARAAADEFPYSRKFHARFLKGLLDDRCYYGIDLDDSSEHSWLKRTFFGRLLDKKLYDMLFFACNSNPTISMGLCSRAHPLSRNQKRNAFFVVNALSLMLCLIYLLIEASSYISYRFQGHSEDEIDKKLNDNSLMWNFLVVVPIMAIIEILMFYVQSCPCCIKHSDSKCLEVIKRFFIINAKLIGFLLALAAIGAYYFNGFLASTNKYFTDMYSKAGYAREGTGDKDPGFEILGEYMYQVFVLSQVKHVLKMVMKFAFEYYNVKICCISVLTFGSWDLEKIVHLKYRTNSGAVNDKVKYKDEAAFIDSICDCKVIIPMILKIEFIKKDVLDSVNSAIEGKPAYMQVELTSVATTEKNVDVGSNATNSDSLESNLAIGGNQVYLKVEGEDTAVVAGDKSSDKAGSGNSEPSVGTSIDNV